HTAETASGAEALAKFASGNFDVVVTDQVMAHINGSRLATELKKLRRDVPVILLTGFVEGTAGPDKPESVDFVVEKPVSRAALRNALARVVSS
ncbi:MAG: response regulator, partial [Chthoniobacterales bacterium]